MRGKGSGRRMRRRGHRGVVGAFAVLISSHALFVGGAQWYRGQMHMHSYWSDDLYVRARVESSLPGKFTRNFYPAVQTAWTQPYAVAEPVGLTPASASSSASPSSLNRQTRLDRQGASGAALGLVGYSVAWTDTASFSTKRLFGLRFLCL